MYHVSSKFGHNKKPRISEVYIDPVSQRLAVTRMVNIFDKITLQITTKSL